jgi:hypothetical protein
MNLITDENITRKCEKIILLLGGRERANFDGHNLNIMNEI